MLLRDVTSLRILTETEHPQARHRTQGLTESMNMMDIWNGTLNLLFIKGSYTEINYLKK